MRTKLSISTILLLWLLSSNLAGQTTLPLGSMDRHERFGRVKIVNNGSNVLERKQTSINGERVPDDIFLGRIPIAERGWSVRAREIVKETFLPAQHKTFEGYRLNVEIIFNSQSGKVIEVYFDISKNSPLINVPDHQFSNLAIRLKNEISFIPTEAGKTLNYGHLGFSYLF